MLYELLSVILFSLFQPSTTQSCAASNITDAWTIGTTITQTSIAAAQVIGASGTFFADYIFYKKTHSKRNQQLIAEIEELRKKNTELKMAKQRAIVFIYKAILKFIDERADEIKDDQDLLRLLEAAEKLLIEIASDQHDSEEEDPLA